MDGPSKAQKRRRHGHISVACQACKNRRSKCSGGPPPCSLCAKLETECHFDPDADMRRRTSRDNTKTYKALLDAFVESLRRNDIPLALSLHQVIKTADQSGRLPEVAEEYADTIRPGWLASVQDPQVAGIPTEDDPESAQNLDFPSIDDLDENFALSMDSISGRSTPISQDTVENSFVASLTQPERRKSQGTSTGSVSGSVSGRSPKKVLLQELYPQILEDDDLKEQMDADSMKDDTASQESANTKDELRAYLKEQLDVRQLTIHDLPLFSGDPYIIETDDLLSKTVVSFRNSARQAINNGSAVDKVLGLRKPDLSLLFRERRDTDPHTAWTWACDFGRAFDNCTFVLRLATVYLVGIQMRFFINPCAETFNDLPQMLRPLRKQYTTAHPAGIELCHIPALKNYYFEHWDQYEGLLTAGQSVNWPYSNAACLAYDRIRDKITLSRAFLEHLRNFNNYSVGKAMLEIAPSLRGQVRIADD